MLRRFHELKKHEEGQALVLGAICMLILTLCVLATVNLSYAATQKIRLQNAADSAAYTTAAYQARALNFMAFTNRTMIVQTASQMNAMAMLTYVAFIAIVVNAVATLTSWIPYVGQAMKIIAEIVKAFVMVLDILVSLIIPIVDGLNFGLALAQTAVSTAMMTSAVSSSEAAARSYNPAYQVGFLGQLAGLGAAKAWTDAVDADLGLFSLIGIGGAASKRNAELNRAFMTDLANSARHKWTAYGGEQCRISGLLVPRRCYGDWAVFKIGKVARTEWGSFDKGSGLFSILDIGHQLYSIDEFVAEVTVFGLGLRFTIGAWASADLHFGNQEAYVDADVICPLPWPLDKACDFLDPLAQGLAQAASATIDDVGFVDFPHRLHLGQMPFASYDPTSGFSGRLDPMKYFNQPPNIVMVTLPQAELLRTGQPFMGKFGARIGTLNGSNSNLDDKFGAGIDGAPKRGWKSQVDFTAGRDRPLPFMQPGFTAMSAAMAYYHRPGDWREPPNLFNPFWGAKLMPVTEFPSIASNPLLRTLFSNQLLVH